MSPSVPPASCLSVVRTCVWSSGVRGARSGRRKGGGRKIGVLRGRAGSHIPPRRTSCLASSQVTLAVNWLETDIR